MLETQRQVQSALTQVRNEQRIRTDLDKRVDDLEMRINGHLLSAIQKSEQEVRHLLERTNSQDVTVLQYEERFSQIEANSAATLELIETLNEKNQVNEQSLAKTREQIGQRFQAFQKQLIETLSQGSATADFTLSFQAYEESIEKMEADIAALKKDFVVYRDRTSLEVRQGIEMIRSTREDYIQRIKDIYDDQARVVRETQMALN